MCLDNQGMGRIIFKIQSMSSIRDFVPLAKLGQGAFSTVYKVRRESDQKVYALKKVRLNNLSHKQKENALNQIRILASFECQTIVGYKQAFFDDKLNVLCIVMEFADGGDLHKFITNSKKNFRKIPEHTIWSFVKDVLLALAHLHKKGILHRDLKSANIFIHQGRFKLGDLNVSKVNGGSLAYTQTGTPYYASPEVWRDVPYDSKSDIWSFGCIVYEMAALCPPFDGKDMDQLYKNVQKGYFKPIPSQYSQQLAQFINKCLQKNPSNRPSASKLLQNSVISHITGENQSILVQNSGKNNELLQTIKLPSDLKCLKVSLPDSKYESEKKKITDDVNMSDIKNFISDRPDYQYQNRNLKEKMGQQILSPKIRRKTRQQTYNNSEVYSNSRKTNDNYASPRNANKSNIYANCKSPQQLMSKKLYSAQVHHSQKKISQNYSDRVSSKNQNYMERRPPSSNVQKSVLMDKYDKFIREEIYKRPSGIPRTQKRIINSQLLSEHQNNSNPDKQAIDEWRKKLVKKSRVLSSNNGLVKPSWMK